MALFRALHRHFVETPPRTSVLRINLKSVVASYNNYRRSPCFFASAPSPLSSLRGLLHRTSCCPRCILSSAASFAGDRSGGSGTGDGGGGGGSGGESGDANLKLVGEAPQELSALSTDVIILDVIGMVYRGCAANVKRILKS